MSCLTSGDIKLPLMQILFKHCNKLKYEKTNELFGKQYSEGK